MYTRLNPAVLHGHRHSLDAAVRPPGDAGAFALQIVSGNMTLPESMPEFVQFIMLSKPTTHFVALAHAILYRGAGLFVVWPQFAALSLIGTILSLSLARFRKTIGTIA